MNNKKVAIIGFGITGQSACKYLLNHKYSVSVFDSREEKDFDSDVLQKFRKVDFQFATNDFKEGDFDLIVASPGVPLSTSVIQRAKEKNIPVHTDVTLFIEKWREIGPIVGVTGSNGKTTIVTLIYKYLQGVGVNSILGGNVGISPLEELDKNPKEGTVAVLELSSYQLEYFGKEHYLDVCLITNLSSNHLDRYGGKMELYAQAKMQGVDDTKTKVVTCLDDPGIKKYVLPKISAKEVSLVSLETQVDSATEDGIYSDDNGNLALKKDGRKEVLFDDIDNRKLIGLHNLYNIAMSYGVLSYLNVDLGRDDLFREFESLEHRIEFVKEINGVKFINDSKSTSPDSTRVALESITNDKNIVLILGGKDKGMDYKSLIPYVEQAVKKIILLPGNSDEKILKTFEETEIIKTEGMEDTVEKAKKESVSGDIILLSPAAASTQPYKNFEERGEHFKEIVSKI